MEIQAEQTPIEGDWKDYTIQIASLDDFDEISLLLRQNFYRDDPLNKLLDWSEEKAGDHDLMIRAVLSHGISLKATDKSTGKIVGVRITTDSRKYLNMESLNEESKNTIKIIKIKKKLDKLANVQEKFKVNYFAEFLLCSIDEPYRKNGLATELYSRNLQLCKLKGFPLIKCCFTNPIAAKCIGLKMGFQELARIYLFDESDKNGDPLFPKASPDQYIAIMALRL